MPKYIGVSGSNKQVVADFVGVGGAWKAVANRWVGVSGAWKQFYTAVALSISLDTGSLSTSGTGNGPFSTGRVTATPAGGVAPYTLHWEYVSGDVAIGPNDSNIANPFFSASGTAPETKTGAWRCKVTDNVGSVAYSSNVALSIQFISGSPSVSLNSTNATGTAAAPGAVNSNTITGTASGGTPGYTYAWSRLSGDTGTTATNPTGAGTTFLRSNGTAGNWTSTWKLTVTDSASATVDSAVVSVSLTLT